VELDKTQVAARATVGQGSVKFFEGNAHL